MLAPTALRVGANLFALPFGCESDGVTAPSKCPENSRTILTRRLTQLPHGSHLPRVIALSMMRFVQGSNQIDMNSSVPIEISTIFLASPLMSSLKYCTLMLPYDELDFLTYAQTKALSSGAALGARWYPVRLRLPTWIRPG
jgi:hypothetical protein